MHHKSMRHAKHVQGHQPPAFANSKVQIDDITDLWPSADLAAEVQRQHLWNSREREYSCADFRPHVDVNELSERLASLTDDLSHTWRQSVGVSVDDTEHMVLEWNSLYGGKSDNGDDGDPLLSLARPDELICSPKFFYELHKAMSLLAKCKNETIVRRKYPGAGRGYPRNSAVPQMPGNAVAQHDFQINVWRRCIFAFKPLLDEWRMRHPRPEHVPPLPFPVFNFINRQDLRQCIVLLCDFLQSLAVARVLLIADLCSQMAMDTMEFQPLDVDETQRRHYFLPRQQTQQRLTLDVCTFVMYPHTTNIQHDCASWHERGCVGKCNNIACICCSCDSDVYRISDSLTIQALRYELGRRYETSDFLKKNRHGIFHMNFYSEVVADSVACRKELLHEVDQQTQETMSIVELHRRLPHITQLIGMDYTLYACNLAFGGLVHATDTVGAITAPE